jgi:uncharacterized OsmC-like protein
VTEPNHFGDITRNGESVLLMNDPAEIRTSVERKVAAVSEQPATGCGTATTRVILKSGLECEITDGPWRLTAGMSSVWGGSNAGPNPGVLGRGSLGACLAIGYGVWAARLGVPISALEVEIQGDYDSRGELGIADDVPPGYLQVRCVVTVTSPAPEADVRRVLDTADKHSPYLDVHARAHDVRRETTIIRG